LFRSDVRVVSAEMARASFPARKNSGEIRTLETSLGFMPYFANFDPTPRFHPMPGVHAPRKDTTDDASVGSCLPISSWPSHNKLVQPQALDH